MKYTGPGVKFKNMIFEDSHEKTIYYVVSAFEQKTFEINDYRVKRLEKFNVISDQQELLFIHG